MGYKKKIKKEGKLKIKIRTPGLKPMTIYVTPPNPESIEFINKALNETDTLVNGKT